MSIQVWWTPERKAEFIALANLTGLDRVIIEIRDERADCESDLDKLASRDYYITSSTYYQHVSALKLLYDSVQPLAVSLPPRQHTKAAALKYAGWTRETAHLYPPNT